MTVFYESEMAERLRRDKAMQELRKQHLRRRMLAAEEKGDAAEMRYLQGMYVRQAGEYFDTTLDWRLKKGAVA